MQDLTSITDRVREALQGLLNLAQLETESIVVVGCSTSEVVGAKIGKSSNMHVAKAIMEGLLPLLIENNLYLAVQTCEHLNRALVVEKKCVEKYSLEDVWVLPHIKAGGALAALAIDLFESSVVVEKLRGHAGLDIGDTFIGMHLKEVVVPVRLPFKNIGQAHLTAARTRPKLIGGERAAYKLYAPK